MRNKAIYLALGVRRDGTREIPGLWIDNTEGAKFWMKVFNDLKTRGTHDILVAITDGLKGMAEASCDLGVALHKLLLRYLRSVCRQTRCVQYIDQPSRKSRQLANDYQRFDVSLPACTSSSLK